MPKKANRKSLKCFQMTKITANESHLSDYVI